MVRRLSIKKGGASDVIIIYYTGLGRDTWPHLHTTIRFMQTMNENFPGKSDWTLKEWVEWSGAEIKQLKKSKSKKSKRKSKSKSRSRSSSRSSSKSKRKRSRRSKKKN